MKAKPPTPIERAYLQLLREAAKAAGQELDYAADAQAQLITFELAGQVRHLADQERDEMASLREAIVRHQAQAEAFQEAGRRFAGTFRPQTGSGGLIALRHSGDYAVLDGHGNEEEGNPPEARGGEPHGIRVPDRGKL